MQQHTGWSDEQISEVFTFIFNLNSLTLNDEDNVPTDVNDIFDE